MYETLMHTLRGFMGTGLLRVSLTTALVVTIAVLAAAASPAFRGGLARSRERGGWRGTLVALGTGVFKFLAVFLMARLFVTTLDFQSGVFARQHGRVTERNRSAVLMKWGYPHEQRELSVSHTRQRAWITRQLQVQDGVKTRVLSESYWKDEEPPVNAVDGRPPAVISVREESRDVAVTQKSIVSADIDVTVRSSPRRLGNANYAGYADEWRLRYVIANRSRWETDAHASFPLPAKTGLFDGMSLSVNGQSALDVAQCDGSALRWRMSMAPGSSNVVEVGYRSRGLEHLRYIPKRMSQTGHYRVSATVHGIAPDELDYPIGSMPPNENLREMDGVPFVLTWNLDNALTSYDIGLKLPAAEQPNYHFTRLLQEAPVGLVLLLVLLALPRMILGHPVRLELLAILGSAYCLHQTFMGRLADLLPGFAGPFLVSAVLLTAAVVWLRIADSDRWLLRIEDVVVFACLVLLYPLAVIDAERTAFWMQLFLVATLVLGCALLVSRFAGARRAAGRLA